MRRHGGNIPSLPQTKQCPHCPAKYTRSTHLNRHLKTHTKEGLHVCEACGAEFTRSDLLSRHRKTCGGRHQGTSRRKSCRACAESKTKCDLKEPCSRCSTRNRECVYPTPARKNSIRRSPDEESQPSAYARRAPDSSLGDYLLAQASSARTESDTHSSALLTPPATEYTGTIWSSEVASVSQASAPSGAPHGVHYQGNMFDDFFTNVFASNGQTPVAGPHEFHDPNSLQDMAFWQAHQGSPDSTLYAGPSPPSSPDNPQELEHYEYLFLTEFVPQMPIVHAPTFTLDGKPSILVDAVHACGALYVNTKKATEFVKRTLASTRERLPQEITKNPANCMELLDIVTATCLLQTIGLFHERSDERAISNMYHGMLIMMIRRCGYIRKCTEWTPLTPDCEEGVDVSWKEWALHEQAKRALLLSYLHDTCHRIYFALPTSFRTSELTMGLPCEESLWSARTAEEWRDLLYTSSPYGSVSQRMIGYSMPDALKLIRETRPIEAPLALTPMGHFVLIHAILSDLYAICTPIESQVPAPAPLHPDDRPIQYGYEFQYALHNWLQTWLTSPETPQHQAGYEPVFIANCLPFYWLGQITLMAYQEHMPPFQQDSISGTNVDARFRLVKQWVGHIRDFLKNKQNAVQPTMFWDEMMKIRLDSWQIEMEAGKPEDKEGLLGFFPMLGEDDWNNPR
ncbi:hypothetical protein PUNSTDRAFT_119203 [Punctularia strigosozonata HHB-11173 SS5]|uniref:uncharacterized protein n=1 Tax=Punctularia strigosozonata (strain HHB-11173) TaxID=741275 RepID=UPI0004418346|nr:uncharacterized protein PUNSTDRAFT_119203 [Punctularia strigosozonata HHB-11173 SS5]EIN12067.1 hypothetical protein PUNSTDRAFT_119203 [Punctularia strigosozonata HHB-11173 SS5]